MTDKELAVRVELVRRAMLAFGVTDTERIKAIVKLTAGIPWAVAADKRNVDHLDPALRRPQPVFAEAVAKAALECTHGAPTPGHIMDAAVKLGGKVYTTGQGHTDRRWVAQAKRAAVTLGTGSQTNAQLRITGAPSDGVFELYEGTDER